MSALTITAANVVPQTGVQYADTLPAGETLMAGMPVYSKTVSGVKGYYKATANAAGDSGVSSNAVGITASAATAGQPVTPVKSGNLAFGAILTKGKEYCVGIVAGEIVPVEDITSVGHYKSELGIASSTTVLAVAIRANRIQL